MSSSEISENLRLTTDEVVFASASPSVVLYFLRDGATDKALKLPRAVEEWSDAEASLLVYFLVYLLFGFILGHVTEECIVGAAGLIDSSERRR